MRGYLEILDRMVSHDTQSLRAWGSVESWRALRLPLFRALVADQLELALTETIFGEGF